MTEYVSDQDHQGPRGGESQREAGHDSGVDGDHLLLMHLLYAGTEDKGGGADYREGFASLDSLREASGLPAWRVWEIIDDLQELDLVTCIWVSGGLRSPSSAGVSGETSSDLRFLRGTRAGLTPEGRSYPPLLEYRRQKQHRRREKPDSKIGQARHQQALPSRPRHPGRRPERIPQTSRGYQIYRPREQAARRLTYLACTLCLVLLTTTILLVLALT